MSITSFMYIWDEKKILQNGFSNAWTRIKRKHARKRHFQSPNLKSELLKPSCHYKWDLGIFLLSRNKTEINEMEAFWVFKTKQNLFSKRFNSNWYLGEYYSALLDSTPKNSEYTRNGLKRTFETIHIRIGGTTPLFT